MKHRVRLALILVAIALAAILAKSMGISEDDLRGHSISKDSSSEPSHASAESTVEAPGPSANERSDPSGALGTVRVEVCDRVRGGRIAGARIQLGTAGSPTELPNIGEAFVIPSVLPIPERLTVEAEGYFARALNAVEWSELVSSQADAEVVTIELAPLGSLVIVAKDNAGKVASGVTISLRPHFSVPTGLPFGWVHGTAGEKKSSSARPKLRGGTTDSDGRLLLEALPTDEALAIKWGGNVQPGQSTCRIKGSLLTNTVEITVHRGVSVRGRFVDRLGAPLDRAALNRKAMRVRLDCARDRLEVNLKEDGCFVFEGIPAGPATLSPLFPDAETFALMVGDSNLDLGDLRLDPGPARLSGRVIAPEGVPLVLIVMGQRGDRRNVLLPKQRTFDLLVAEGPLRLAVCRNGGDTLAQMSCVAPASNVLIDVDALDGGLTFGLSNGHEPSGVFVERGAGSLPPDELARGVLSVDVTHRAGASLPCKSLGGGYYAVNDLEPGLYTLHVISKSLAACSVANVRVERGETTDLGFIQCDHSEVALSTDSGGGYLVFPLAGDRFAIGPGETKQVASGIVHWLPQRIGAGTTSASSQTLAPGERLELPPLSKPGRIEGHALAAFPAVLELRPHGYGSGVPESAMKRLMVGSSGDFVFEDVEPGPSALCLLAEGGGPHLEVPVLVVAGETSRVDLVLGEDVAEFEFMRTDGALQDISVVELFATSDARRYRGRASGGKCSAPILDPGTYLVAVSAPSLASLGEGLPEPTVLGLNPASGGVVGRPTRGDPRRGPS